MYCSKCGKQIPDGSRFCQYCGTKVLYVQQNQPQDLKKEVVMPTPDKGDPQIRRMLGIFVGSAIAVMALVIIAYSYAPENQLVGQWEITVDDSPEYMEFFSDGTVLMESSLAWQEEEMERYDYRVDNLTNTLIIEDYSGEVMRVEFDVSGDYLELYPEYGGVISYRRI